MQRRSSRRAEPRRWQQPVESAEVLRPGWRSRPQVEGLEARLPLGDTLLGLSLVAASGLDQGGGALFRSLEVPTEHEPGRDHSIATRRTTAARPLLFGSENPTSTMAGKPLLDAAAVTKLSTEMVGGWDDGNGVNSGGFTGLKFAFPLAVGAGPTLSENPAAVLMAGTSGMALGTPSAVVLSENGDALGRSRSPFTVYGAAADSLFFDAARGELTIQATGGAQIIHEGITADGFVTVTLDGQEHSSDPQASAFDSRLAGATSATMRGLDVAGGIATTLILDSQYVAGGLSVQADGATVLTQEVTAAGPLTIQAADVTIRDTLQGSTVVLAASGWLTIDAGGRLDTLPQAAGGAIALTAGTFVNSGQVHADGPGGGQIVVQADKVLNAGPITADADALGSAGGQVQMGFTDSYEATTAGVLSASSATGPGGQVRIDGGSTGHLYSSGVQRVAGTVGGTVDLFGRDVVLAAATVDASGAAGGGSIHLGGARGEGNALLRSADNVTVTFASLLRADALQHGNGGQIFVWAEQTTELGGIETARGGPVGGSGGLIDVSGHGAVTYDGTADAGARSGRSGTLLLDPKNLTISDAPAGVFPQFNLIDPHPTMGGEFGSDIQVLANGNVLVANPMDNFGGYQAGAAYLFDGLSGALVSSLVGNHAFDEVGRFVTLANGNYVVGSGGWNNGRGAATWGSGMTGVSGIVSSTNSLVGSTAGDGVGGYGILALTNGNYVVASPTWNGNRGAATWGNGSTGTVGTISAANSLVASTPGDFFEIDLTPLPNGNYVARSFNWSNGTGAVAWGNGSTGSSGVISSANSLVGSDPGDELGYYPVTVLTNGNYVVTSPNWSRRRGAVTWGNGTIGTSGTISEFNSLVGRSPYVGGIGDLVGWNGVTALSNGNYVVSSPYWNSSRGAVTWGNGSTGTYGFVSEANSLTGDKPSDLVGGGEAEGRNDSPIIALSNGNYVVRSTGWEDARGAVTWGNGSTGTMGIVSTANSLVGIYGNDWVGNSVVPLSNGNYVVTSSIWNAYRGAATWGSGTAGVSGTVSSNNSLVGGDRNDRVGSLVTPLSNGNYVVGSPDWNSTAGAATWGDGSIGVHGVVSAANSLVGSNYQDRVGYVLALSNGNYVVTSPAWNNWRGAATWGSGEVGVRGTISAANSLVGSNPEDEIGSTTALRNGNYVVASPGWDGGVSSGRGAVTWGDGSAGIIGPVSEANSLVGRTAGDYLGDGGVLLLSDGNYLVKSSSWNSGQEAVTWVSGTSGNTLDGLAMVTPQNSLLFGRDMGTGLVTAIENVGDKSFIVHSLFSRNGPIIVGFTDPGQLTYPLAQAQSLSLTPAFLRRTLETGTAVVLQASNDITVNSPISVAGTGKGGSLTLQAGRSIILNASITTDNGSLTLIANDEETNGVVDAQRDPGAAVIAMAPGMSLNTGSGALTVTLRDGAGLSHPDSGAITLQDVIAGVVSVSNNGRSLGSDLTLGTVTSRGPQSYASPNGTITVRGNLTAADQPLSFSTAVTLTTGIVLDAGVAPVNFTGGTVALPSGVVSIPSGVMFSSATALVERLNSTDPGGFGQLVVGGPISLGSSTLSLFFGVEPPVGSRFEILTNTGNAPIVGSFSGLAEGAVFALGNEQFQIAYQGGTDGDSVVLTRLA